MKKHYCLLICALFFSILSFGQVVDWSTLSGTLPETGHLTNSLSAVGDGVTFVTVDISRSNSVTTGGIESAVVPSQVLTNSFDNSRSVLGINGNAYTYTFSEPVHVIISSEEHSSLTGTENIKISSPDIGAQFNASLFGPQSGHFVSGNGSSQVHIGSTSTAVTADGTYWEAESNIAVTTITVEYYVLNVAEAASGEPFTLDIAPNPFVRHDDADVTGAGGINLNSAACSTGSEPMDNTNTGATSALVAPHGISSMIVTLMNPQDIGFEELSMNGSFSGILVSGNNTTTITVTSDGSSTVQEFRSALDDIFYRNTSVTPNTAINRLIDVQIIDKQGRTSNIATANFPVTAGPISGNTNGPLVVFTGDPVTDLFSALDGTEDAGGVWVDINATGALTGSMVDPTLLPLGGSIFRYDVAGTAPCGDASTSVVLIMMNGSEVAISSPSACAELVTEYQDPTHSANSDDPIFVFAGGTGDLSCSPGAAGTIYDWYIFNPTSNSYDVFALNSTPVQSGLADGGYLVVRNDAGTVEEGRAWVWNSSLIMNAGPDQSVCEGSTVSFLGSGTVTNPTYTYYDPVARPLIIDATTEITITFDGLHTYVSDLGFFAVAPDGATAVTLGPNQGNTCNPGQGFTTLSFTTNAVGNLFDFCMLPAPLTGTYDQYFDGTTAFPIDWSPFYGFDARQGGWAVQVYDCVGADVGSLTGALIEFNDGSGNIVTYASGSISVSINDNSCTPGTASIYVVPFTPPSANNNSSIALNSGIGVGSNGGYEWSYSTTGSSGPWSGPFEISTLTPSRIVNQTTWFRLEGDNGIGCSSSDVVMVTTNSSPNAGEDSFISLCDTDPAISLFSELQGSPDGKGAWSGPSILTGGNSGTFDPSGNVTGEYLYILQPTLPCTEIDTAMITVIANPSADAGTNGTLTDPIVLTDLFNSLGGTPQQGGIWTPTLSTGTGMFDPFVDTTGVYTYTITSGNCGVASATVTVGFSDTDNDGIPNITDIDDDNDGILDSIECNASFFPTSFTIVDDGNLDGMESGTLTTASGLNGTWNISHTFSPTGSFVGGGTSTNDELYFEYTGDSDWDLTSATFSANTSGASQLQFTLYGYADADAVISNASMGSRFGTYTISWVGGTGNAVLFDPVNQTTSPNNTIITNGGSFVQSGVFPNNTLEWYVVLPPGASSFSVSAEAGAVREAFRFSAVELLCQDTDNDGIVNTLDSDSDGDGCSDATESGHGLANNLDTVAGPYGANGFADVLETPVESGISNYTITDNGSGTPMFLDTLTNGCMPDAIVDLVTINEDETNISIDVQGNDSDPQGDSLITTVIGGPSSGGTVSIVDTDSLLYNPPVDFNGVDTIVYQICDTTGACDIDTVFITVNPINDGPIVDNENDVTNEDVAVSGDLTDAGDSDPDGTTLDANTTPISGPTNGTIVISIDGSYTYTPDANFNGLDTVVVEICDNGTPLPAICANDTIFITVNPVNDPPVVDNENETTNEDAPVSGDVTDAGDNDVDGNLVVNTTPIDGPDNGTIIVNPDGTFTYTPDADYFGVDTIVIEICDDGSPLPTICVNDTIFVTVNPINDSPIVDNEIEVTDEDIPVSGDLTDAGDNDVDGNLVVNTTPIDGPDNGTIVVNSDGTYTYTPDAEFSGSDTVIIEICDDGFPLPAICVNDTIFITVNPINDTPVVDNENVVVDEDMAATGDLTDVGDSDVDGNLVVNTTPIDGPDNGTIVVNPDGTYTYTPDADYYGVDTIVIEICDDGSPLPIICVNDTIFVVVEPVNDAPTVDNENDVTDEDTPVSGDVTDAGDSDVDGNLVVNTTPIDGPDNGTIIVNPDGTYTYTPDADFNGADTVVIEICDDGFPLPAICVNDTIFITVNPINDTPVVDNEDVVIDEDMSATGDLTDTGDLDVDGNLVVNTTPIDGPDNGTIVVNSDGTFTYTPDADYFGSDTIVIEICDDGSPLPIICVNDTIFVTVNPINDAPVVDNEYLSTEVGVAVDGDLTDIGDLDVDGNLVVNTTPIDGPDNGTIVINADGSFTYTPDAGFSGMDTVLVEICDDGFPTPIICVTDTIFINVLSDNDGDGIADLTDVDDDNDGIPDYVEICGPGAVDFSCIGSDPAADDDGDGIPNYQDGDFCTLNGNGVCENLDTDGDGIIDIYDLDSDNDGLSDIFEGGGTDANNDGLVDEINPDGSLINDADGDGWADNEQLPNPPDFDNDGQPDFQDLDADNDGIPDIVEAGGVDFDLDGMVDDIASDGTLITDPEGDGWTNSVPVNNPEDTDGDGNVNHLDLDTDNDGIPDILEDGGTDTDGDGQVDGFTDANGDGWDDDHPLVGNTDDDGDGVPNTEDLDSDNDGIADIVEGGGEDTDNDGLIDNFTDADGDGWDDNNPIMNPLDTDGDGFPDYQDLDSDNDGVYDVTEGNPTNPNLDPDNDGVLGTGTPVDSDGDGLADEVDSDNGNNLSDPVDTDGDGVPDYQDVDSDNDGIFDVVESGNGALDTDNDGYGDSADTDGDGIQDVLEDPSDIGDFGGVGEDVPDFDGDGVDDYLDLDSDNDGITDVVETGGTDADGNGQIDDFTDADGDGADDTEIVFDPIDTDGDGLPDYTDLDADNDGIPDIVEAGGEDVDGDGTIDDFTDPDGDGWDTTNGTDPPTDTDGDGVPDYIDDDSDNDGISDVLEAGGEDVDGDGQIDGFTDLDGDGWDDNNPVSDPVDTDGDGNPDFQDTDSDGDGLSDEVEYDFDGDGIGEDDCDEDGIPDHLDTDRCDLFIPEAITPNGDGYNEVLEIPGLQNFPGNTVMIFNRWGTKVFEMQDYDNSWNGTANTGVQVSGNDQLPSGTYYYVIDFNDVEQALPTEGGTSVEVVRLEPVTGFIYIKR